MDVRKGQYTTVAMIAMISKNKELAFKATLKNKHIGIIAMVKVASEDQRALYWLDDFEVVLKFAITETTLQYLWEIVEI